MSVCKSKGTRLKTNWPLQNESKRFCFLKQSAGSRITTIIFNWFVLYDQIRRWNVKSEHQPVSCAACWEPHGALINLMSASLRKLAKAYGSLKSYCACQVAGEVYGNELKSVFSALNCSRCRTTLGIIDFWSWDFGNSKKLCIWGCRPWSCWKPQ